MEQHPIPQDVTGFQFKLIGAMTVKQFGFVAVGAILAVVSWYAPVPGFFWNFVSKGICLPIFGLSGVIIAFVPIEGRPVDVMAVNFFHALTSPNQYIYKKRGKKFSFTQMTFAKIQPASATQVVQKKHPETGSSDTRKEQQLRALLSRSYLDSKSNIDKKEIQFLQSVNSLPPQPYAQPAAVAEPTIMPSQPHPQFHPTKSPFVLPQLQVNPKSDADKPHQPTPAGNPQQQQANIPQIDLTADISRQKVLELEKQTQDINAQKDLAEHELLKLKTQMSAPVSAVTPAAPQPAPAQDIAHVRNISQNMIKNAGFSHIPDSPNIIVGIVKDARGNMLPNILVEIKDKEGSPVRAFKTNPLGQFASATPLTNSSYTIELEDPKKQHAFDVIQITADGQIMMPIEIISHDAREELRKALFTN